MLFPTNKVRTQLVETALSVKKQVIISVLRLDEIHPVVSGNKLFKLHYFLQEAMAKSMEGIVSFGGAYSNHLVATAFACKEYNIKSIGIVRGEHPAILSHTLQQCIEYGMELVFIAREQYHQKEQSFFINELSEKYKHYLIVPEGGYHPEGALGASLIMDLVDSEATHICCAVGTATTVAGLLLKANDKQQVVGLPVLKGMNDLSKRVSFLTGNEYNSEQLKIIDGYHFGGYAKKTTELISFMNDLFENSGLATDFVYTGKMMYGVMDCLEKNLFPKGSRLVCLHTGGLQGNLSLPTNALIF